MNEDNKVGWQYTPGGGTVTAEAPAPAPTPQAPTTTTPPPPKGGAVSWTASEFIDHDRAFGWYALLGLATLILAAIVFVTTRDYFAVAVILIVGFVVAAFARKKPRQLAYELNDSGLKIGEKNYAYGLFKSFSIARDEALPSINLMPLRRFQPPISVYFAAQDEEQITSVLGAHLPYEDQSIDRIDRLSKRLRF